jgi:hypothetical protein
MADSKPKWWDGLNLPGVKDVTVWLVEYDGELMTFEVAVWTEDVQTKSQNLMISDRLKKASQDAVMSIAQVLYPFVKETVIAIQVDIGFYSEKENSVNG